MYIFIHTYICIRIYVYAYVQCTCIPINAYHENDKESPDQSPRERVQEASLSLGRVQKAMWARIGADACSFYSYMYHILDQFLLQ